MNRVWDFGSGIQELASSEPPHPVIVIMKDNKDYIRVLIFLLYRWYRGWGSFSGLARV